MKKLLATILLALPIFVSAHGSGGYVEKVQGEYLLDIGFTNPTLVADENNRFDFGLYKANDQTFVEFDTAWVRFSKGEEVIFIGNLPRQGLNAAIMTYTFPSAGNYVMTVNYLKDQKTLAQADFPLTVNDANPSAKQSNSSGMNFVYGGIGLVLGLVLGRIIKK